MGVAKLSTIPKMFNDMINERISAQVIDSQQHGFTKIQSTIRSLLEFNYDVKNSMERGNRDDVVYIDFEKALDQVPFFWSSNF